MPDFVPYQTRHERPTPRDDGKIALSPERWELLRDYLASLNIDGPSIYATEIKLDVMIDVAGITFLPGVYLAA